jgi:hypothetical protein
MTSFPLNTAAISRAKVIQIGEEGTQRALLIDDFFANPDEVRQAALDPELAWIPPTSGYPGIRSYPRPEHLKELITLLGKLVGSPIRPDSAQFAYSMVTKCEEELIPAQRRPHFDGPCTAGIIFLNSPNQCCGGTGFYRHRATGLSRYPEKVTDTHLKLIKKLGLKSLRELQNLVSAPPPDNASGYITDSNREWEQTNFIEMKFNRLIMYDGQLFHSGVVRNGDFGETPRERRLTLNYFVDRI